VHRRGLLVLHCTNGVKFTIPALQKVQSMTEMSATLTSVLRITHVGYRISWSCLLGPFDNYASQ